MSPAYPIRPACGAGLPGPRNDGAELGRALRTARARFFGIRRRGPDRAEATGARAVGGEAGQTSLLQLGAGRAAAGPAFSRVVK